VTHGNTIVHSDGIEFFGDTAGRFDLSRDQLAQIFYVHVSWYKKGEGVDHGDNGLFEVVVFHASSTPQRAGPGHVTTVGGCFGSIVGHRL
jgi:hypothetical protein